jgi:predicted TPR repeat methyltransferase|tara:strand:+ start:142 stop:780 length:639 start_codon:yes stop_codon:yes gene_type:complete
MTKVHIPNNDSHLDEAYNLRTDNEAEEFYNNWATDYDDHLIKDLNYNAFEHVAKDLASVLPRRDARILDVGTGTGLTGQALANLGFKNIDGWDISEKMLKEAMIKKVYRNLLTINLNESKYPVMSRYDAAVSSGTFTKGHVKHDALPYIIEILKPGGYFACTINIGIWEELGFKYTIEQLEKDNIISIEKYTDRSYFNDDTLECRCFLFKKL